MISRKLLTVGCLTAGRGALWGHARATAGAVAPRITRLALRGLAEACAVESGGSSGGGVFAAGSRERVSTAGAPRVPAAAVGRRAQAVRCRNSSRSGAVSTPDGGTGTGGTSGRDKPVCPGRRPLSQIVLIGDSYINWVSHTFPTDIDNASMLTIEDFAIGGTSMGSGKHPASSRRSSTRR